MFTEAFSVCDDPLNLLVTKTQVVITAIKNKDETIVKKLLAMAVHTRRQITLEQRFPFFLIRVGRTRIAIDKIMASLIKVRVTTRN